MPDAIKELQKAICETHGCDSRHVESVPVTEKFDDQIAWQGTVEVFDLIGQPKAKRAYAWTYREGDQNKTIAVLEIPPVDSPQMAVKVYIASKARNDINLHFAKDQKRRSLNWRGVILVAIAFGFFALAMWFWYG